MSVWFLFILLSLSSPVPLLLLFFYLFCVIIVLLQSFSFDFSLYLYSSPPFYASIVPLHPSLPFFTCFFSLPFLCHYCLFLVFFLSISRGSFSFSFSFLCYYRPSSSLSPYFVCSAALFLFSFFSSAFISISPCAFPSSSLLCQYRLFSSSSLVFICSAFLFFPSLNHCCSFPVSFPPFLPNILPTTV